MESALTPEQEEVCKQFYHDALNVDQQGVALDVDSLNIVNILVAVVDLLSLDLYDVLDMFEEQHFSDLNTYMARLKFVVNDLRKSPDIKSAPSGG